MRYSARARSTFKAASAQVAVVVQGQCRSASAAVGSVKNSPPPQVAAQRRRPAVRRRVGRAGRPGGGDRRPPAGVYSGPGCSRRDQHIATASFQDAHAVACQGAISRRAASVCRGAPCVRPRSRSDSWVRPYISCHRRAVVLAAFLKRLQTRTKKSGMKKRSMKVAESMPPSHGGADGVLGAGAGPGGEGQRQDAEEEGQRGHDDRTEPDLTACQGRLDQPLSLARRCPGELDDQDGVLGGQPQGGEKPDLEIDVIGQPAQRTWPALPPITPSGSISRLTMGWSSSRTGPPGRGRSPGWKRRRAAVPGTWPCRSW